MRSVPFFCLLLSTALTVSVMADAVAQGARLVKHPTSINIPPDDEATFVIRDRDSLREIGSVSRYAAALRRAVMLRTIGAEDGSPGEMFGGVADVAATDDGRFFVLDAGFDLVREYSAAGSVLSSFGREGEGPMEFMQPQNLLVSDDGERVVVLDRSTGIKVFRRSGGEWTLDRHLRIGLGSEGICLLQNSFYLNNAGVGDAPTVHAFTLDGRYVASFGQPYVDDSPLLVNQLSDGPLACSEEAEVVAAGYEHLPLVRGYSPEGELRWVTKLEDFEGKVLEDPVEQIITFGDPPADHFQNLRAIGDGMILAQVATRRGAGIAVTVRTYLIDARTGEGQFVSSTLPRYMAARRDRLFVHPLVHFPQVGVMRWQPPASR